MGGPCIPGVNRSLCVSVCLSVCAARLSVPGGHRSRCVVGAEISSATIAMPGLTLPAAASAGGGEQLPSVAQMVSDSLAAGRAHKYGSFYDAAPKDAGPSQAARGNALILAHSQPASIRPSIKLTVRPTGVGHPPARPHYLSFCICTSHRFAGHCVAVVVWSTLRRASVFL
jgi:hypothetical protein